MTRWLVWGIFAAIAGALLVVLISQDSGYILINIGPYSLETSFWFGIVCVVLIGIIVWRLLKLFRNLRNVLAKSLGWISESRDKRFEKRNHLGQIFYVTGNWPGAKRELLAAAKLQSNSFAQYLGAAASAIEMGEEEEARFLLEQAEKFAEKDELPLLILKAKLNIETEKYEQALVILERCAKQENQNYAVSSLLLEVYRKLSLWSSILELLPKCKALNIINSDEMLVLEVEAWKGQFKLALEKASELSANLQTSFEKIWKDLPSPIKKNSSIVAIFVEKLFENGFYEKAERVLVSSLSNSWDATLLDLYGNEKISDKKQQLVQAESWLRSHPGDANLMLLLGKLSKANKLWGKARNYLQSSVQLNPNPKAHIELADLLAELGEHEESVRAYRKGLLNSQALSQ